MATYTHKTMSLAAPIAYSLIFHVVVLGSVLTMPLYTGGWGRGEPFIVRLESAPAVSEAKTAPDDRVANGPGAGRALLKEGAPAVRTPKLPKLTGLAQEAGKLRARQKMTDDTVAKPEQEEAASGATAVSEEKAAMEKPLPAEPRPEEAAIVVIRGSEERVETPGATPTEAMDTAKETEHAPSAGEEATEADAQPDAPSERPGWQEPGVGHQGQEEAASGPEIKVQAPSHRETGGVDRPAIVVTESESENPEADMARESEARGEERPAERPVELIPPAVGPSYGGLIEAAPAEAPPVPEEAPASASAVDMLCMGCLIMAGLDGNPVERVLGDADPKEMKPSKEIFLSPLREFCRNCLADEESEKAVVWKVSEGELEVEALAEAPDAEDSVSPVAEILTPENNLTPTGAEYVAELDETLRKMEEEEARAEEGGQIGLPLPTRKDLEIRVFFEEGIEGISFRLLRRPHPMDKMARGAETDITGELEELVSTGGSGLRAIYSLSRAERGVYVFVVENSGASADVGIRFLLYGGIEPERAKEYSGSNVAPGAPHKIKFLMPEAVFWDDEDYFTGEIEGPDTVTKFSDVTGLVWKEYVGR